MDGSSDPDLEVVWAEGDDRWNENIEYHRVLVAALPTAPELILDFGCGEGILTREAAAARPDAQVIGIDPDEASIRLARATTSPDVRVEYLLGDAMVDLEPATFDAVLSVCALHHVGTAAGLRRCAALVRPGGVVAVEGVARVGWRDLPRAGLAFGLAGWTRLTRTRWEHSAPMVWPPDVDFRTCQAVCEELLPDCRWHHEFRGRWTCLWTRACG